MFLRRRPTTEANQDAVSAGSPGDAQTAQSAAGSAAQNGSPTVVRPGAHTAGKGRPTPKRSEAEQRRRQPYAAPKDRKEAARGARDRERERRGKRMEAMRRGEAWALSPKDRGPVRALARDFVDSRRRVSEFYMYVLIVLLVAMFAGSRSPLVAFFVPLFVMVVILAVAAEGLFIGRRIRALAAERLPGESTRGVRWYAVMRALQARRLRLPKPRVKPGDSI